MRYAILALLTFFTLLYAVFLMGQAYGRIAQKKIDDCPLLGHDHKGYNPKHVVLELYCPEEGCKGKGVVIGEAIFQFQYQCPKTQKHIGFVGKTVLRDDPVNEDWWMLKPAQKPIPRLNGPAFEMTEQEAIAAGRNAA